jgi:hypothetical protein
LVVDREQARARGLFTAELLVEDEEGKLTPLVQFPPFTSPAALIGFARETTKRWLENTRAMNLSEKDLADGIRRFTHPDLSGIKGSDKFRRQVAAAERDQHRLPLTRPLLSLLREVESRGADAIRIYSWVFVAGRQFLWLLRKYQDEEAKAQARGRVIEKYRQALGSVGRQSLIRGLLTGEEEMRLDDILSSARSRLDEVRGLLRRDVRQLRGALGIYRAAETPIEKQQFWVFIFSQLVADLGRHCEPQRDAERLASRLMCLTWPTHLPWRGKTPLDERLRRRAYIIEQPISSTRLKFSPSSPE